MKKSNDTSSFSRIVKSKDYGLISALMAALGVLLVWISLGENDVAFSIFIGIAYLVLVAILLVTALLRVNISSQGVTMSLCGITLKKVDASELCTIVKTVTYNGRWHLETLTVFCVSSEEMEAYGEQRLQKNPLKKGELKFRDCHSDWGDVCMGVGFYRDPFFKYESPLGRWKSGIWLEYSPEREEVLRQAFPQAQYRVPKRYSDPPSRN